MIITNENASSRNCVVIPLISVDSFKKSDYYEYMRFENNLDFVYVEDGSKDFHFSKSMNRGIDRAIDLGYDNIILSTNNIKFNDYSDYMTFTYYIKNRLMDGYHVAYRVNNHTNGNMITNKPFKFLLNGISNELPFFTLRQYMGMKKAGLPPFYSARTRKGFPGTMPLSIYSSNILKEYKFDENIKNSSEDIDLGYRLWKDNIKCHYIPVNIIHRGNQSFKTINRVKNPLSGYYDINDWSNNTRYLYKKYFGDVK